MDPTLSAPMYTRGSAGSPARSAMRPHAIRARAPVAPDAAITDPASPTLIPSSSWTYSGTKALYTPTPIPMVTP